jgi:predicted DNA-binding transcriptional regulator YafY
VESAQRLTNLPLTSFTDADRGVLLRSAVNDLDATSHDLAGLGVRLRIHHPPELRDHLRRYALSLIHDAERNGSDEP